jgi:hypothetical protein
LPIDLKRRHPLYESWFEDTGFLLGSYDGGKAYHDGHYLDQYPREYPSIYRERKKRAYLLNHFAAVVDAYIAAVYRRDPVYEIGETRELTPELEEFVRSSTADGMHLNIFSRQVATFALAAQRAFVGVDLSNETGLPYCYLIHPANVLDYSQDPTTLEIRWALIAEKDVIDDDPFSKREERELFRLWRPDEWVLIDKKKNVIDQGKNPAGRVPILYVPGSRARLPVYDIALINKRIYNMSSQLDEIFVNVTFPMLYVPAGEGVEDVTTTETELSANGDVSALKLGPARVLELPTDKELNNIIPGFLAPPEGPAKLLQAERAMLADAILGLAGMERRRPDSLTPESGIAKEWNFRGLNERFVSLAQVMEEFAIELFDLVNAFGIPGEVNVTYNKSFHVRDFEVLTQNHGLIEKFMLPSVVKKRSALELSLAIAEEATAEEKEEIRAAVEEMTEFDQPGLNGTVVAPDVMQRTQAIFESRFGSNGSSGGSES